MRKSSSPLRGAVREYLIFTYNNGNVSILYSIDNYNITRASAGVYEIRNISVYKRDINEYTIIGRAYGTNTSNFLNDIFSNGLIVINSSFTQSSVQVQTPGGVESRWEVIDKMSFYTPKWNIHRPSKGNFIFCSLIFINVIYIPHSCKSDVTFAHYNYSMIVIYKINVFLFIAVKKITFKRCARNKPSFKRV